MKWGWWTWEKNIEEWLRKRKPMMGKGRKQRVHQLINHAKWWRLRFSLAEHNENHELELQGVWEPSCRYSPLSLGEGTSSQCFVSDGNKKNSGWDKNVQAELRYDNFLAVCCVHRAGGLAMLWKNEVNLDIQTYSLNHIDARIMTDPQAPWRITGFYGKPEEQRKQES